MNKLRRLRRPVVALVVGGLLVTACGLKPEVKQSLRQAGGRVIPPGASYDPSTGQIVDESGNVIDPGALPGADPGTGPGAGPGSNPGTNPGANPGTNAGPSTGTDPGAAPAGPGDTTGIRGGKLYIALHGPLTGAGVPQRSFETGTKKYWDTHKIRGMTVVGEAFDDEYSPGGAIKVCRRAAPDYFMIIGGAGTDQIQACAKDQVVQRGQVPYVSAGVTTNGLTGLRNYFAASMTYAQQGPTVVKMAKEKGFFNAPNGWALVISRTPNFADAKASIEKALDAAGMKHTYIPVEKVGDDSTRVANALRAGRYETVYFLGQPQFFAEVVGKVRCTNPPTPAAYCPHYTGVGISMGVNTVARLACGGSTGFKGHFLSPYPGFNERGRYAPGVQFEDDIEFSIYGIMQMVEQMFAAIPASQPLTRQNLIAAIAAGSFRGGIFNPAVFAGRTHFGGTKAFYLKANCTTLQWETAGGPTA